jgi:hypothetical protein
MDGDAQRQRVAKNRERKNRRGEGTAGRRRVRTELIPVLFLSNFTRPGSEDPLSVSCENHSPISNTSRTNNVTHGKHGSRCYCRAVHITPRNPNVSPITVSDFRRNLVILFCPRLKVSAREFGKLDSAETPCFGARLPRI